jgi:exonuclease III
MILLSLNIRGVGGPHKLPSLRRLLDINKPDIIFLQETLVDEEKARKFLFSLCPSWMVCALSSMGKSGGLLAAWNPTHFLSGTFSVCRWNSAYRYTSSG